MSKYNTQDQDNAAAVAARTHPGTGQTGHTGNSANFGHTGNNGNNGNNGHTGYTGPSPENASVPA